jgi:hypothetical protein
MVYGSQLTKNVTFFLTSLIQTGKRQSKQQVIALAHILLVNIGTIR